MGEGSQAQLETQTKPHHDDDASTATAPPTQAAAASTAADLSSDQPTHQAPPPKIPSRPKKIRKLSSETFESSSSQIIIASENPITTTKNKIVSSQPKPIPRIIARSLSCHGEIEIALRHLRNVDPQLSPLIDIYPPPTFEPFQPPFLALAKSIIYQQLAYKAGTSIYNRFVSLCGGEAAVLPDAVLAQSPQQLRQIGISARKSSYLHDLARKYQNGILSDSSILEMDDKSLFTMLTMVNGIGSWSVHMFMIFSLHRPDVLPVNDNGVRKGIQSLYGLEELPRPSQMEQLCEKWRPYRSVGSWYMWRFVEATGAPPGAPPATALLSLQQQQPQQQQFVDPTNSILNLGACAWGQ